MSDIWGHAIGVMIVIIMTTFLGIWIWAWRGRHKPVFQQMAAMPMEDSAQVVDEKFSQEINPQSSEEKSA